jgi:hypothetical protein
MATRLPLAGERAPVPLREAPSDPGRAVLSIVPGGDPGPAVAFARALVVAARARGLPVAALSAGRAAGAPSVGPDRSPAGELLREAGADPVLAVLAGERDIEETLLSAIAEVPQEALVVAFGDDVPAVVLTRLTVVVGPGAPAELRERADLELAEARPAVATGLAALFACGDRPAGL